MAPTAAGKCVVPGSATATGAPAGGAGPGSTAVAGYTCLQGLNLPIGWTAAAWPGLRFYLLLHLLGIVMLGVATSFGAPFWFGVIGSLVNLRGAGQPPPPAAEQRPTRPST